MMPAKPNTARTMMSWISPMPRALRIECLPCNRLFDAAADPAEVAEVHPHPESATFHMVVGDETPVAAVAALVAVVAHHEVVPRGHGAAKTVVIVFAILAMGELADLREIHRRLPGNDHHLVGLALEFFHEGRQAQVVELRVGIEARCLHRRGLAIDRQALAAI